MIDIFSIINFNIIIKKKIQKLNNNLFNSIK